MPSPQSTATPGTGPGSWLDALLDNLLPRRCVLCMGPGGADNLCSACRADLPRARSGCPVCALPAATGTETPCAGCRARPPPWDAAIAALDYRFPVDALVGRFKFNRQLACGAVLASVLLESVLRCRARQESSRPDCIVPVPLHRLRQLRRSFNQADLLARPLGRALGLPVRPQLLRRHRYTRAQSGLGASERRHNLRSAFRATRAAASGLAGAHVALVDDVLTTGATLDACCHALRRAGVSRVEVWVAARAQPPASGK